MATLATNDFNAALKIAYLDPLNDNVVRKTVILDRLQKNSEDVSGQHAYVALISARNPGVGSRADTAGTGPTLPEAGNQTYTQATFKMTYHYGRAQISGPAMRASKNNKNAFAKAMEVEMEGLSAVLPEDLNRQLWSYGHGRAMTLAAAATAGATQVTVSSTSIFGAKVGDRIHFSSITAGTLVGNANNTVSAISRDTNSTSHLVSLSGTTGSALTVGTTGIYFGSGASAVQTSRGNDMMGIPAAVDDGNVGADELTAAEAGEIQGGINFGGITRTASSFWSCQMLQNPAGAGTNRPLTNSLLQQAFLTQTTIGGADQKSIEAYTNPGIWGTWGLLHIGDRRYSDYQDTLEGGWMFLKFNGIKVFYDRDCPRDIIWFLDMSKLMFLTQSGYEFMEEDGNIFNRVSGVDAYEFTLYRDCQIGMKMGKCHVRLDDISSNSNIEANV